MKILNIDTTEQITIKAGGEEITIQPIRKSGRKVCIGIVARREDLIGNPTKIKEAGLENYQIA